MISFSNIIHFQSLDSTSEYIKRYYRDLSNHTVVVASFQTEGKGQFERVWESQEGKNLLFSILFKEDINPQMINQAFILSMSEILNQYDIKSWFKEPNDIYIYEKKVSGILMETKFNENFREYLVVGIGINVNQQYFESPYATSISLEKGLTYDLHEILEQFLTIFAKHLKE